MKDRIILGLVCLATGALLMPVRQGGTQPKVEQPVPVKRSATQGKFMMPDEIKPRGQYFEESPVTDAKWVTYVGRDGVEPLPNKWLNDKLVFLMDSRGLQKGRYRFTAVASFADGEPVRQEFVAIIGDAPPVPPGPVPPGPIIPPGPLNPVAVTAVVKLTGFKTQANALANFYRDYAKVLQSSTLQMTTAQFTVAYGNALKTFVAASEYAGAPAISADVNAYMTTQLGPPVVGPFDATLKAKTVKAFNDLEAALRELVK